MEPGLLPGKLAGGALNRYNDETWAHILTHSTVEQRYPRMHGYFGNSLVDIRRFHPTVVKPDLSIQLLFSRLLDPFNIHIRQRIKLLSLLL